MSYLGTALQRVAEQNDRTQRQVAETAHIATSQLSRIFNGAQKWVSDEDFAAIVAAITRDPRQRAEIIAARCRDVKTGPNAELVKITIEGKPSKKSTGDSQADDDVELSHEHERALAFIRAQIPLNPALGEVIVNHAKMIGMK